MPNQRHSFYWGERGEEGREIPPPLGAGAIGCRLWFALLCLLNYEAISYKHILTERGVEMSAVEAIEKFAAALVEFINIIKEFFAKLGGATETPEA